MKTYVIIVSCLLFAGSWVNAQNIYEGTNIPYIHPRSEWLNTQALQNLFNWQPYNPAPDNAVPDYYPPRQIVLHDEGCNVNRATCNDDVTSPVTMIQNIYRFHAVTRGWGDIGYHYIIDRSGGIWEGRYGGAGVRGGHLYNSKTCQNFNVGSIGILLLGNYYDASIPQPMLDSVTRLSAWLAVTNNIDITNTSSTIPIWTNQKDAKGKCVSQNQMSDSLNATQDTGDMTGGYAGAFTTTYIGATLNTHRGIEPTNSDIRNINLDVIRSNAVPLIEEYKQYAYKSQGSEDAFDIVKSSLQKITDTTKKIIALIQTQLDIFRPEQFAKKPEPKIIVQVPSFPDGTLLKQKGSDDIYLVKNQIKIPVGTSTLLSLLGLASKTAQEIEAATLQNIPSQKPLALPDTALVKSDNPEIYYMQDSKRYRISSIALLKKLKLNPSNALKFVAKELELYPLAGYVKWPEGTTLQNQNNKKEVYIIKKDKLKVASKSQIKKVKPQLVSKEEIASYQTASVINAFGTLSLKQIVEKLKDALGFQIPLINAQKIPDSTSINSAAIVKASQEEMYSHIRIALCNHRDATNCSFSTKDNLTIKDNGNGTITVDGYEDRPGFSSTLNDNTFRGKVTLVPSSDGKQVWLINELSLEDYLQGIAETAAVDLLEYRKGHTLIARTYAYYYLTQEKRYPNEPFDLTNTSQDQVYRGYNFELRSNGLALLVQGTKGLIITYQGKPIVAAYSSDSGGISKNGCAVWIKYCAPDGKLKPEFAYLIGGIQDPEGTIHDKGKMNASHGVGVSTAGARKLIESGKTFQDMIAYYYPGVVIQKIY